MRQRDLNRYLSASVSRKKSQLRRNNENTVLSKYKKDKDDDFDKIQNGNCERNENDIERSEKKSAKSNGSGSTSRRREEMINTALRARLEPIKRKRRLHTLLFTLIPLVLYSSTIFINILVVNHKKKELNAHEKKKSKPSEIDFIQEVLEYPSKYKQTTNQNNNDGNSEKLHDFLSNQNDDKYTPNIKETKDMIPIDDIFSLPQDGKLNNVQNNEVDQNDQITSRENNSKGKFNSKSEISLKNKNMRIDKNQNELDRSDQHKNVNVDDVHYDVNLRVWPGVPLESETLISGKKNRKILNYDTIKTKLHSSAGLHCDIYGGPKITAHSNTEELEVVYWEDIPQDASYKSPFYEEKPFVPLQYDDDDIIQPYDTKSRKKKKLKRLEARQKRYAQTKYLTFEPDHAGWNNKRMGFETMVILSHALGRTLVLPPKRQFYDISKGTNKLYSYDDFYHLETLIREYEGVNIISMENFLEREAMNGRLKEQRDDGTETVLFPPKNQTNWDHTDMNTYHKPLNEYLRKVSHTVYWKFFECVAAFPSNLKGGNEVLEKMVKDILRSRDGRPPPDPIQFQGKPVPVNFPTVERYREIMGRRPNLCLYTDAMKNSTVLHFHLDWDSGFRMLTHFYSFLFFEDWRQDTWVKRFVRDNLRYNDEIQCAASRIIESLRNLIRMNDSEDNDDERGVYDAVHVRRGDFQNQYPNETISAGDIVNNILNKLGNVTNSTLYVATDETDLSFFDPLKNVYKKVYFLKDFMYLIKGVDSNYLGMIEQIVAARSGTFWGSHSSTFSGYIMRLRGYYSVREKWEGYEDGSLLNTYYLSPKEAINEMRIYHSVAHPFYHREFPVSWRNINKGLGETGEWKGW